MGIIEKFESAMQGIVEGSFGRVFRTRLQPVELARKLERAMESNLTLMADRRIAPTHYRVHLSPNDYEQLSPYEQTLTQQLADALITTARDRHYMLAARPSVLLEQDPRVVTGQVRIETRAVGSYAQVEDGDTPGGGIPAQDETRTMSPAELRELEQQVADSGGPEIATANIPPAWLTLFRPSRGQPMRIDRPVVHLGRNLTNDVVINDKRVSRYHAEIRCEHNQFVLYDLGSTNGVRVNGVPTRQAVPLRNNDVVGVGSHEFVFQRR